MTLNRNKIILILVILGVAIQLVPIDRTNPPVTGELAAPPELHGILRRACYDCHSNETVWPWYSRVAPVSWLVASDVYEGREHLNFSIWNEYPDERRTKLRMEISKEVREAEMPPFQYVPAHPEAKLSEGDKGVIHAWAGG